MQLFWVAQETRRTASSGERSKIQLSDGNLGKTLIEKAECYCVIIITRIKKVQPLLGLKICWEGN